MLACGICAMGVRRYYCASPDCAHSRFFCQSYNAAPAASKPLSCRLQHKSTFLPDCDWQHITFTMPHVLWPFFNNNWLLLLNDLFRSATRAIVRFTRKMGIEIGIFCALHTYGRQLGQHPHINLSITRGGVCLKHGIWRALFFKKKNVEHIWRIAVTRLLRRSYDHIKPGSLPGFGQIRDNKQSRLYLEAQYQRHWNIHFAKKTRGAVVHHYYDHRIQLKLTQKEIIGRYISHVPSRHFKMVRYYGFLLNRKRGTLLSKMYKALDMEEKEKPEKPDFATLMKGFMSTDRYKCILCGDRLQTGPVGQCV